MISVYALKRMINHSNANDVTGNNYVGKSENQMRVAWQTVADPGANASGGGKR